MQFLRTLFWVAVAVALVLFATANWHAATLKLWGGLQADVKLPVLILAAFLLGFLPTFLLYRARMWSMRRRVEAMDRQLAAIQQAPATSTPPATAEPAPPADPIIVDTRTSEPL